MGPPFKIAAYNARPTAEKKKNHHPALVHTKETLATINQRTQVDGGYEHSAALVLVPCDSYTIS